MLIGAIKKKKVRTIQKKITNEDERDYLELLAFFIKERLSFIQISQIGRYLRKMAEQEKLGFLKTKSFDEEDISNAINCLGTALLDQLKEELESAQYSCSIDSSTVSGENICALKVRYQTSILDEHNLPLNRTHTKLIGIKTLQE